MKNLILLSLLVNNEGASLNVWNLVLEAGWVVKAVMLLLLLASIFSWTIIFWKRSALRTAASANHLFAEKFWAAGSIERASDAARLHKSAPMTRVFEAGLHELGHITKLGLSRDQNIELLESNVARSLQRATKEEMEKLSDKLSFLANTASAAPFIGLFGTVWGIMTSFINIGATGASNLAVVAPGIAEALIATAMGLFAAIPAVLAFNFFTSKLRSLQQHLNSFSTEFLNTAKRSL